MITYIHGRDLHTIPDLAHAMFRDRAVQFHDRLRWDVTVDAQGEERDQYDDCNPLYVIWREADGSHGGSMRFLPTDGRTMVNEHFLHLTDGVEIRSPLIWECTRFCLAPTASPRVAAALMLAGGEIMRNCGVEQFVGVFDARMERIYRRIGATPDILGSTGEGRARIGVGLWSFTDAALARVSASAGIAPDQSRAWFEASVARAA